MLRHGNFLRVGNFFARLSTKRNLRNQRLSIFKAVVSEENENVQDKFSHLVFKTKREPAAPQKETGQFQKNRSYDKEKKVFGNRSLDEENTYDNAVQHLKKLKFVDGDSTTVENKPPKNKLSFEPITEENMYDKLAEVVSPLEKTPYFKQLRLKHTKCIQALNHLAKELKERKVLLPRDSKGLPCPLEQVRPSPETSAYRNKDEFGIRHGIDGDPKTVGFFIGSPADNSKIICVHPKEVVNIKPIHLQAANHFQQYIRQSPLPACINFQGGHWHHLLVRSNADNDLMIIITMHPQNLTEEEIESEKEKIKEYFTEGPGNELNVKSLFFQACRHTRCSNEQAPFQLLFGEPYIFEQIGNLKFRVSPETFLQINTSAAPVLYDTVRDLAGITSSTTVLDVCCGAGSLGMYLAEKAGHVIGIEISRQATDDAKCNIEMNGIKNMAVIQGTAEMILPRVIEDFYSDDLVAIVNPPRAGLKKSVSDALRACKHLRRIIYISCKPDGKAMTNFVQLCATAGKKRYLGPPFVPLYAIPVDLFPHTHHYELVIMFERATT